MKIIQETSEQIILKTQSFLFAFLIGLVFFFAGMGMILNLFQKSVPWWLGVIFVGCGLLPIVFGKQVKVIFDKPINKITILKKRLLGKEIEEYNLSGVKKVIVRQTLRENSRAGFSVVRSFIYSLVVILDNNIELSLEGGSSSLYKTRKIAEKISAFLGIFNQDVII